MHMDKKTNIFFGIIIIITLISVVLTFYRSFITKNYEVIPVPEEVTE